MLITGGDGSGGTADDLYFDGAEMRVFSAPRVATRNTHGTGCTLSSAIAAYLGLGFALENAIAAAKAYVTGALQAADKLQVGRRHGPLNHFSSCGRERSRDYRRSIVF